MSTVSGSNSRRLPIMRASCDCRAACANDSRSGRAEGASCTWDLHRPHACRRQPRVRQRNACLQLSDWHSAARHFVVLRSFIAHSILDTQGRMWGSPTNRPFHSMSARLTAVCLSVAGTAPHFLRCSIWMQCTLQEAHKGGETWTASPSRDVLSHYAEQQEHNWSLTWACSALATSTQA